MDHLGVSLEDYRDTFRGSWMFGYIDALQKVGIHTVLLCVSARVSAPWYFVHKPTGARVSMLPAPTSYRAIRRRVLNPYAETVVQAVGKVRGVNYLAAAALKHAAPYLATPIGLLAGELRRERCKAILCQGYEHARFDACVLLGRLLRIPVFATFQGGDRQVSRLERLLRPHTLRACAGLIIGTRSEEQRVKERYGLSASKLTRIFNPISTADWHAIDRADARTWLGLPHGARVVAWHGRVHLPAKGVDILMDAWQRVCEVRDGVDLKLLLVGTGENAADLRRMIAASGLSNILWVDRFVHDRAQLRLYLSAADIYAFPSRHEGFPVAPIEAMCCGLPIVAADAPGVPDIFEDGENSGGVVVARGDAQAFAEALGRMLDNGEWARQLGIRARSRVHRCFSLEAVGAELRTLLLREATTHPAA